MGLLRDETFNAPTINSTVYDCAELPDGKVIIVGSFTNVGGVTRQRIARLNEDGSHDTTFVPSSINGDITHVRLLPDGRMIIMGSFTTIGGVGANQVARLNADGTRDATYTPGFSGFTVINAAHLFDDGGILIGGNLTTVGGVSVNDLVRLLPGGSRDTSFTSGLGAGVVSGFSVDPSGRIVVWGSFTTASGFTVPRYAVLEEDGTRDTGYEYPAIGTVSTTPIQSARLDASGRVFLQGEGITTVNGETRKNAKVDSGGNVVGAFPVLATESILAALYGADDSIMFAETYPLASTLVRYTAVGGSEPGYVPLTYDGGQVRGLTRSSPTRVWATGDFTTFDSVSANRIVRLIEEGPGPEPECFWTDLFGVHQVC